LNKIVMTLSAITALLLLPAAPSSFALELTKTIPLTSGNEYCMGAVFSPDGTKISFSKSSYNGLYVMNLDGTVIQKLTDEPAAGFRAAWLPDSKSIIYRANTLDTMGRIDSRAVKVAEVSTGKKISVISGVDWVALPGYSESKGIVYSSNGKLQQSTKLIAQAGMKYAPSIITNEDLNANAITQTHDGTKLIIEDDNGISVTDTDGTNRKTVVHNGENDLAYGVKLSPDGTKFLYHNNVGAAVHLYITSLDTLKTLDCGQGFDGTWMPDSNRIMFCIATNDGYDYTDSAFYIISADNTNREKVILPADGQIRLYPAIAPDSKSVIYTDHSTGKIMLSVLREK